MNCNFQATAYLIFVNSLFSIHNLNFLISVSLNWPLLANGSRYYYTEEQTYRNKNLATSCSSWLTAPLPHLLKLFADSSSIPLPAALGWLLFHPTSCQLLADSSSTPPPAALCWLLLYPTTCTFWQTAPLLHLLQLLTDCSSIPPPATSWLTVSLPHFLQLLTVCSSTPPPAALGWLLLYPTSCHFLANSLSTPPPAALDCLLLYPTFCSSWLTIPLLIFPLCAVIPLVAVTVLGRNYSRQACYVKRRINQSQWVQILKEGFTVVVRRARVA